MRKPILDPDTAGITPHPPAVRALLGLGGGYNALDLAAGCGTLTQLDQRLLRRLIRKLAPWLKSRGLVTIDEFTALWTFCRTDTVTRKSTLSRSRLEHALSGIDRRTRYSTIRRNALFMLTLGLGIHPTDSATLTVDRLEEIRQLHKHLGCYTQWAWQYVDKLLLSRRFHLRPGRGRTANRYLFINLDGTTMSPTFAMDLAGGEWPTMYGLTLAAALRAHRTLAVEYAGAQFQIDSLYKELFGYEDLAKRAPDTGTDVTTSNTGPQPPATAPLTLTHYRPWITANWLTARRHQAIREYLSGHRAKPVYSDSRQT